MDPNLKSLEEWGRAGLPALVTVAVWLELRSRIKRLEEKVGEHNRFEERIVKLETADAYAAGERAGRGEP